MFFRKKNIFSCLLFLTSTNIKQNCRKKQNKTAEKNKINLKKTIIEFQDEEKREGYLAVAETSPKLFLKNEKPILFDEWQDAPKIWGTIRKACDDNPECVGEYYLTGSSSKKIDTPHTGTGRITEIPMFPMTLWEMGDSNGKISLSKIMADAIYQMEDGRYALIEIKTGANKIPEAEKSLLRFRDVIRTHNDEATKNPEHPRAVYREPSALIVICATAPMGYTTDNGVKIIPIGCLKD